MKNRDADSNKCETFQKHKDKMGDEEIDLSLELQADLVADAAITWPDERYVYVKLCYDRTVKNQLEQDNTDFKTWAEDVMTHTQAHYRHPSLPLKIQFKVTIFETRFGILLIFFSLFSNHPSSFYLRKRRNKARFKR